MAIIRIARLWPVSEGAAAPKPAVAFTDLSTDSLDAFGSESVALQSESRGAVGFGSRRRRWLIRARAGTGAAPLAALKWVGVVMLSATTAAAAVWEYQRTDRGPRQRVRHHPDHPLRT